MLITRSVVVSGTAEILGNQLRCLTPMEDIRYPFCNHLIAMTNRHRQLAGELKCKKCKRLVEVVLVHSVAQE